MIADADGGITRLWRMTEWVGLGRISLPIERSTRDAMGRAAAYLGRSQGAANVCRGLPAQVRLQDDRDVNERINHVVSIGTA